MTLNAARAKDLESQFRGLTREDKRLVLMSMMRLAPAASLVAELFCRRAANLNGRLSAVFGAPDAAGLAHTVQALAAALTSSSDETALAGIARLMGTQARVRGLRPGDYVTCADALFWTLERSLRHEFTPELRAAWCAFTLEITSLMLGETREKPKRVRKRRRPVDVRSLN